LQRALARVNALPVPTMVGETWRDVAGLTVDSKALNHEEPGQGRRRALARRRIHGTFASARPRERRGV
jgi:hypothetical protein